MLYRRCKKFLFDRKKFNLLTKFPKFPYRLATIAVAHRAQKIQKRAIWRKNSYNAKREKISKNFEISLDAKSTNLLCALFFHF